MAASPDGKEEMKRNNLKLIIPTIITLLTLLLVMGIGAAACEGKWENPEAVQKSGESCANLCEAADVCKIVGTSNGYVAANDVNVAKNDTDVAANDVNVAYNDTCVAENGDTEEEIPENPTAEEEKNQPTDEVENNGAMEEKETDNTLADGTSSQSPTEKPLQTPENEAVGGEIEKNLFEEIYSLIELNADKIFSILAFIGTLVVGVGYKSGLLPLLRDALSKLKGSIDRVKEEGELSKLETSQRLNQIVDAVDGIGGDIEKMRWQYDSYELLCRERESMRLILEGQIDMLYAIFMTSALPQYQKDEIGERISEMREELKKYEKSEEN